VDGKQSRLEGAPKKEAMFKGRRRKVVGWMSSWIYASWWMLSVEIVWDKDSVAAKVEVDWGGRKE
jgi:hypothetical protein